MASKRGKQFISIVLVLVVGAILSLFILFPQEDSVDRSAQITVTGILELGVEGGCLVLKSDDGMLYTLLDLPNDIPPVGSRITVTGTVEEDVVTSCMQGTALRVVSLSVLSQA